MKDFLKMTLACVVGFLIINIIGFFLMFAVFAGISSMATKTTLEVSDNSILFINLNKPINDRASDNPLNSFDPFSLSVNMPLGLNNILKGIERAKYDSNIKGIYMDLSTTYGGIATLEEIREAILDFKTTGKFVLAYADSYSQGGYFLATVADKIYLNPYGDITLKGLSSNITMYKGLLDKLGVEMQIIRHGKFKSAVEPFIYKKISPENREQISTFMGSIWHYVLQSIEAGRNISIEEINKVADNLGFNNVNEIVEKNFVDELLYKDQVISEICKYVQVEREKNLKMVDVNAYGKSPNKAEKTTSDRIAVIYAQGEIMKGKGEKGIMSSNISQAIARAREDDKVKAVVFRVNSPGGEVQASEIISREIELTNKVKPVIVSMGDYAASGGYWISAPSTTIVANHTTITGSIGVFGVIPNAKDALENKIGLSFDVVNTNQNSDFGNITRPLNSFEVNKLQSRVEDIYTKFITKVAKFRNMTSSGVDSIGQGRVWSGNNAITLGLIDEFGGLNAAVNIAAQKAGISEFKILELPREKNTMEIFMSSINTKVKSYIVTNEIESAFKEYRYIQSLIKEQTVQARIPYSMEIE